MESPSCERRHEISPCALGGLLARLAVSGAGGGALGRPARGPQTPEGVSMQGGDGVPWPAAGADFPGIFFFFCTIFHLFS